MDFLNDILGLHTEQLKEYQMALRALIVFFSALALIRIAGIRTLGKTNAFDNLTALMLGAILGRSVVSNQSFWGHLLASLVIVLLHRLVAWITFKSHKAGRVFKGDPLRLMDKGEFIQSNLKKAHITKQDMEEGLRLSLNADELEKVKDIYLERSGDMSFVKKPASGKEEK
jgi:uncharacterized membrane protein YcaP (DUF421 family)